MRKIIGLVCCVAVLLLVGCPGRKSGKEGVPNLAVDDRWGETWCNKTTLLTNSNSFTAGSADATLVNQCCLLKNGLYNKGDLCRTYCDSGQYTLEGDDTCCLVDPDNGGCAAYCEQKGTSDENCCYRKNSDNNGCNASQCSQNPKSLSDNGCCSVYALNGEALQNFSAKYCYANPDDPPADRDRQSYVIFSAANGTPPTVELCQAGGSPVYCSGTPASTSICPGVSFNGSKTGGDQIPLGNITVTSLPQGEINAGQCSNQVRFCFTSKGGNRGLLVRTDAYTNQILFDPCNLASKGGRRSWDDTDLSRWVSVPNDAQVGGTQCAQANPTPVCSGWMSFPSAGDYYQINVLYPWIYSNQNMHWSWLALSDYTAGYFDGSFPGGSTITYNFD